ncbi:MAG: hypothetical protein ACREI8_05820 [Myxococcota bacterium]
MGALQRSELRALTQRRQDLTHIRETPGFVLAEDALAVGADVEDAVITSQQLGRDAELLLDRGRQTGGLRQVVSAPAVVNGDLHGLLIVPSLRGT